ncbi:MAG: hypothetical protein AAGI12_11115 [Pseudomonadota bacterium]
MRILFAVAALAVALVFQPFGISTASAQRYCAGSCDQYGNPIDERTPQVSDPVRDGGRSWVSPNPPSIGRDDPRHPDYRRSRIGNPYLNRRVGSGPAPSPEFYAPVRPRKYSGGYQRRYEGRYEGTYKRRSYHQPRRTYRKRYRHGHKKSYRKHRRLVARHSYANRTKFCRKEKRRNASGWGSHTVKRCVWVRNDLLRGGKWHW